MSLIIVREKSMAMGNFNSVVESLDEQDVLYINNEVIQINEEIMKSIDVMRRLQDKDSISEYIDIAAGGNHIEPEYEIGKSFDDFTGYARIKNMMYSIIHYCDGEKYVFINDVFRNLHVNIRKLVLRTLKTIPTSMGKHVFVMAFDCHIEDLKLDQDDNYIVIDKEQIDGFL